MQILRIEGIKTMVYMVLAVLFLCVTPGYSYEDIYAQWGVGFGAKQSNTRDDIKYVELGLRHEHEIFQTEKAFGGWVDNTDYPGVKQSFYFQYLVGIGPELDNFYITYWLGPAFITSTDSVLGSHLQLSHELGIGVKDFRGVRAGLCIKHLSNAGIVRPNLGRNFVGIMVQF